MSPTTTRTRVRPHLLVPDGTTAVDLVLVVLLGLVALSGLHSSFTGWSYLVVGLVGLLLGVATTYLTRAAGWPLVAPAVVLLVLFFLVGGPLALRSYGNTAFLPTGSTLAALADQAVFGWKDFLTTLPPVDGTGPLLVLPLVTGLVGGLVGTACALARPRRAWLAVALPVVAMTLLLVAVILLGVRHPASLLVQGAGFAVLALGWLALRARRYGAVVHGGSRGWGRLAVGAALLLGAAGLAVPASTVLGASDEQRAVARNWVEPPFEIGQYPSPLAGFRRYVDLKGQQRDDNVHDELLFSVDGVPAGTRMRLAALDHYDGMVWGASDDPDPAAEGDTFQRVSSTIDNPLEGEEIAATVTVGKGGSGVWLPTAGGLTSLRFEMGDARTKAESFRYNLATSTAVVPSGIHPGDVYSFSAVLPDDELTKEMVPAATLVQAADGTAFLDGPLAQWTKDATSDTERLLMAAEHLRTEGRYSDGVVKAERHHHAGHGLYRLHKEFVAQETMVGNDEQYAAVMALVAQKLGMQARVVLGAVVPDGGQVHGKDVQAWVEVRAADGSWRTLPTEAFMSHEPPTEQMPETEEPMTGTVVPPPNPIPPPSDLGELTDADLKQRRLDGAEDEDGQAFSLPAWVGVVLRYVGLPLGLLLALVGAVVGAKALRRRRRRTAASASARFVGAWRELVDQARDLGQPVPVGATVTRREQARGIGVEVAPALARRADSHVFGPAEPRPADAAAYWEEVDGTRRRMTEGLPWHRRLRAALNLTTLRPVRRADGGAGPGRVRRVWPRRQG